MDISDVPFEFYDSKNKEWNTVGTSLRFLGLKFVLNSSNIINFFAEYIVLECSFFKSSFICRVKATDEYVKLINEYLNTKELPNDCNSQRKEQNQFDVLSYYHQKASSFNGTTTKGNI